MMIGIVRLFISKMFCNRERLFRMYNPCTPGYNNSSNNLISSTTNSFDTAGGSFL